jgi:hypothetical protein
MLNRRRSYTNHFLIMALLTAVAIGVVNYLSMEHRARIDLTADKRFTLSEGTKRLFERLPETVTVTYYVDEEPPAKRVNLERDVVDKLEEIARASGGKLQYRVDRISNVERAERRRELEELGVTDTVDVLTAGAEEAAEARGVQGFYSSLEIRYGAAEPLVINEIVNLVDRFDEMRQHRVDTLEFDIAYSILRLQNTTDRPSIIRLLRAQEEPIVVRYMRSAELPSRYAGIGENVHRAMQEIADEARGNVNYRQILLDDPWTNAYTDPFGSGEMIRGRPFETTLRPYTTAEGQTGLGQYFLFTELHMQVGEDRYQILPDFREHSSVSAARALIEDAIWELSRPRSRVGVLLPPSLPQFQDQQRPGDVPWNYHTGLFQYLDEYLDYDVKWVDIEGGETPGRDLACLLVLEPNVLTERQIYAIDRYLAEGGNVALFVQGWDAELANPPGMPRDNVPLQKKDMQPHFESWARHIGLEFGQDLLLAENALLTPYFQRRDSFLGDPVPGAVRLAPRAGSETLNRDSIIARALTGLPLPLPVELKVDDARVTELGLEKTEIIRLRDGVYRLIPASMRFPEVPMRLSLPGGPGVEDRPDVEPGEDVRAQRLGHEPLIAVQMRGRFPSMWADNELPIPGKAGDDPSEETTPPVIGAEGSLIVFSTAGILNTEMLRGHRRQDFQPVVIDRGTALYRNIVESFVYGDDLVGLRARTGTAPRIQGTIDQELKVFWFLVTVLGVPLFLVLIALSKMYLGMRSRAEYEARLARESTTGGGGNGN